MKKIFASYVFMLLFCFSGFSQNLIPNGDFEEYNDCPLHSDELEKLEKWFSPTFNGTPEYLHTCVPMITVASVPHNFFGFQYPQSGEAFVGLILHRNSNSLAREYVSVPLISKLEKEKCYQFEMFVNLNNNSQAAIDKIAAYFSDTLILNFPTNLLPFTPQIENLNGNILSDTLNWMTIKGTFQAKGNEKYLIIGNFRNNEETKSELVNPNASYNHGYYYIDNVSLVKVDCKNYIVPKSEIIIYPNPTSEDINIKIKNQEFSTIVSLQLFSANGQLVASNQIEGKDIYTWNLVDLPEGVYFLEINLLGEKYFRKVIKVTG